MDPKHFIGTTGSSTVVAAYVALTPHAMGYIVLNEAEALGLRVASFLNQDHIVFVPLKSRSGTRCWRRVAFWTAT